MKYLYIFVAIILFVAVYYFVAGPPSRVVGPAEQPEEEVVEELLVNEGAEPAQEEAQNEPGDMTFSGEPGTDVGMELPIADPGVVLETKVFNVDSFSYGYSLEEIRVKEGDTVTINLTVSDGFHDWVVDEFDAATEKIREGGLTSVTFVADKAGTYEYYCSVGAHRALGMVGKLIVE